MFKVLFKSAIKNYKLVLLMKRLCLDLVSIFLSKHFLCILFAVTPFWSITNTFHYILMRLMKLGLKDVVEVCL